MREVRTYDDHVSTGAYTSGRIYLTKNTELYIYVGDNLGFNGGGLGGHGGGTRTGHNGGGATDIRLVSGTWDDATSLNSRIMVAAGAGGVSGSSAYSTGGGSYAGDKYSGHGGTIKIPKSVNFMNGYIINAEYEHEKDFNITFKDRNNLDDILMYDSSGVITTDINKVITSDWVGTVLYE